MFVGMGGRFAQSNSESQRYVDTSHQPKATLPSNALRARLCCPHALLLSHPLTNVHRNPCILHTPRSLCICGAFSLAHSPPAIHHTFMYRAVPVRGQPEQATSCRHDGQGGVRVRPGGPHPARRVQGPPGASSCGELCMGHCTAGFIIRWTQGWGADTRYITCIHDACVLTSMYADSFGTQDIVRGISYLRESDCFVTASWDRCAC